MGQRITTFCDVCADTDENSDGAPHHIQIAPYGMRTIDLCEAHAEQLIAPLRDALETHGRKVNHEVPGAPKAVPVPRTRAEPAELESRRKPCPYCETKIVSVVSHVQMKHPERLGDYYNDHYREGPIPCPVPKSAGGCKATFGAPQGAYSHAASAHNWTSPKAALRKAAGE